MDAGKSVCSRSAAAIVRIKLNHQEYQTLAHEVGHTLGASHDGEEPCEHEPAGGYLMAASLPSTDAFSQCTIDTIRKNMERYGDCYEGEDSPPTKTSASSGQPSGGGGSSDMFLGVLVVTGLVRVGSMRQILALCFRRPHQGRLSSAVHAGGRVRLPLRVVRLSFKPLPGLVNH
jgi:hypothetical protein